MRDYGRLVWRKRLALYSQNSLRVAGATIKLARDGNDKGKEMRRSVTKQGFRGASRRQLLTVCNSHSDPGGQKTVL